MKCPNCNNTDRVAATDDGSYVVCMACGARSKVKKDGSSELNDGALDQLADKVVEKLAARRKSQKKKKGETDDSSKDKWE